MSFVEAVAGLTIVVLALTAATPVTARMVRGWRLDGAARGIAMEIHRARMEALARGRYTGILFEHGDGRDRWRFHTDSSGDRSLTAAAIASGADRPIGPVVAMGGSYSGVRLGIPGGGPVPRIPPGAGFLAAGDDPVAFGSSDIFSASPTGECSAGTIYLTDGMALRAVVVHGATGRVRVWRWDLDRGWALP